jgi:hypothetical protein
LRRSEEVGQGRLTSPHSDSLYTPLIYTWHLYAPSRPALPTIHLVLALFSPSTSGPLSAPFFALNTSRTPTELAKHGWEIPRIPFSQFIPFHTVHWPFQFDFPRPRPPGRPLKQAQEGIRRSRPILRRSAKRLHSSQRSTKLFSRLPAPSRRSSPVISAAVSVSFTPATLSRRRKRHQRPTRRTTSLCRLLRSTASSRPGRSLPSTMPSMNRTFRAL